jgi:H+/Cl- antiporter ClcA
MTSQTPPAPQTSNAWKIPIIAIGGALGAIFGVVASRLFIRADEAVLERDRARGPQGIKPSLTLVLPLALTLVGLLRDIGSLGKED